MPTNRAHGTEPRPRCLSIEMSVTIDPTSSDDGPGSIEFSLAFKVGANRGDYTLVDSEVTDERRGPVPSTLIPDLSNSSCFMCSLRVGGLTTVQSLACSKWLLVANQSGSIGTDMKIG
jgi:hypothetical protein